LVDLLLGAEFESAFVPMVIYLLGSLIAVASFAAYPALLSTGHAGSGFGILVVATLVYLAALPLLSTLFELHGAAAAFAIFYFIWASLMYWKLNRVIDSSLHWHGVDSGGSDL
jgi:O-antigen/teichoic acid export membrane protein